MAEAMYHWKREGKSRLFEIIFYDRGGCLALVIRFYVGIQPKRSLRKRRRKKTKGYGSTYNRMGIEKGKNGESSKGHLLKRRRVIVKRPNH